jgi:hypothetical protein
VLGERDLRAFCRQPVGTPVTFGAVATYPDGQPVCGILDLPQQIKLAEAGIGGVEAVVPELRLPFNAFKPMPASGDTLTVAGQTFTVNEPTAEDDGAFLCYELLEA